MKKILLILTIIGVGVLGLIPANASYYTYPTYSPSYYYYGNSSDYYGSGGIGSYTIGCTTYYYNTRTRAQLYTQNICNSNNYQPSYQYYQPSYQTSYQYESYYPTYTQYYTYPYYTNDYYYGNGYTNTGYNNYNSYLNNTNCYYQNGYQYCY